MTLLKIALIFLISTTAISAAPGKVRSYSHCGASWLKLKCSDCSSSGQQCTDWSLQQCKQCNLGPKAKLVKDNGARKEKKKERKEKKIRLKEVAEEMWDLQERMVELNKELHELLQ